MTPLLCACAVVITLETQKCRKRGSRSVEFDFFINCDRQKRFSQNQRGRADLQHLASDFLIFAPGLSSDLSKLSEDFTPFFPRWKTITKSLGKKLKYLRHSFEAMTMMNKCAKFHKDSPSDNKINSISRARLNFRRRPFLCTTFYSNLMQASNFGGTFDQFFLWIFLLNYHRRFISTSSIPWCKKVKNDQKLKTRGSCLKCWKYQKPRDHCSRAFLRHVLTFGFTGRTTFW